MSDEMDKALKADGEKLRGLTGMGHGPFQSSTITDDELLADLRQAVADAMGQPYAARMHDSAWEQGALVPLRKLAVMLVEAHDKWEECQREIVRQREHIAGLQAAARTVQAEYDEEAGQRYEQHLQGEAAKERYRLLREALIDALGPQADTLISLVATTLTTPAMEM